MCQTHPDPRPGVKEMIAHPCQNKATCKTYLDFKERRKAIDEQYGTKKKDRDKLYEKIRLFDNKAEQSGALAAEVFTLRHEVQELEKGLDKMKEIIEDMKKAENAE
ncbi:hypothetical protein K402DRAFT_408620 [Aulographum hederae CBS 113979]|uniref:Uncharacterized protein n=1 Tax=Aulographum hederae CBS 113979 TaxID=1176131 RepID=A0A6G1GJS0_9PEZI|nr:hypothetical protein K402DRAFT_408620 [Aulographum hederae CBS 113979]